MTKIVFLALILLSIYSILALKFNAAQCDVSYGCGGISAYTCCSNSTVAIDDELHLKRRHGPMLN